MCDLCKGWWFIVLSDDSLVEVLGSRHMDSSSLGFIGYVMLLTCPVGSVTGVIIPCAIILSSSASIFSWYSIGVFLTGCWTGLTSGSLTIWYLPSKFPIISNCSWYCFIRSETSVTGPWWVSTLFTSQNGGRGLNWSKWGARLFTFRV